MEKIVLTTDATENTKNRGGGEYFFFNDQWTITAMRRYLKEIEYGWVLYQSVSDISSLKYINFYSDLLCSTSRNQNKKTSPKGHVR